MTDIPHAVLHVTAPDEPERAYVVDRPVTRIGREAGQCDLLLAHGWVSRNHARIYADRLPLRIQDMRSSNGTIVNDRPLVGDEVRALADGDVIAIGPFRLRYQAPPSPAEQPAPPDEAGRVQGLGIAAAQRVQAVAPPPETPSDETAAQPAIEPWAGMPQRASRWLQYLPPIYSEDDFLGRFLLIFEDLVGPAQQTIAHFSMFLDPALTPVTFLPWLHDWLSEVVDEHWPAATQRQLLSRVAQLYEARGTKAGLVQYLRICTGCEVDVVEGVDGPHTFRVAVHGRGQTIDRRMVERIVRANCPAHAVFALSID